MILILTPLSFEHDALLNVLGPTASRGKENGFPLSRVHDRLALAVGGIGKVQFALSTLHWIDQLKPELVICAGCAGALVPEVRPGDVVLAEATLEHDFKSHFVKKPWPRFEGHAATLERFRARQFDAFHLHVGTVASGDEDIVHAEAAKELHERTQALAVAWEGAGGARACRFRQVPYLEVRGISDRTELLSRETFRQALKKAMNHVGEVLRPLVTSADK